MFNILVVDDSAVDRKLISGLIMQNPQFQVVEAESGAQALNRLAEWDVDLVVTDLQMPGIDGLELVTWIRQQHPDIPTILATGQGSEEIASRALSLGAAGYVPKARMAELLVTTMVEVLDLMFSDRACEKIFDYAHESMFAFELGTDPSKIPPVIDLCVRIIASCVKLDRIERLRISVALEQALHNAIYRGNLEVDSNHAIPFGNEAPTDDLRELLEQRREDESIQNRTTRLSLRLDREKLTCKISDQGPGFSDADQEVGLHTAGRGIVLMSAFMDEISFSELGNEVTLVRKWSSIDPKEAASDQFAVLERSDATLSTSDESEPDDALRQNEAAVATVTAETPAKTYGLLKPVKGGEAIVLTGEKQLIGRSKTCHVVLPFQEVSSHHCQIIVVEGWWCVKDMKSANGISINGKTVAKGRLMPGDVLGLGKRKFTIEYDPSELGAVGITPPAF